MEDCTDSAKEAEQAPKQWSENDSLESGRTTGKQIQAPGDQIGSHDYTAVAEDHCGGTVAFPAAVDQGQTDDPGRTDHRRSEQEHDTEPQQKDTQADGGIIVFLHIKPLFSFDPVLL